MRTGKTLAPAALKSESAASHCSSEADSWAMQSRQRQTVPGSAGFKEGGAGHFPLE